ncbi:MAG: hypothetical protein VKN72_13215 [Nostocales cyanobacterium 94392]|nr:hypothetical protein [Nostocales cyanobacterium 94392]
MQTYIKCHCEEEDLGGRALTPESRTDIANSNRTKEQQQIDTLLASWKRVVQDNLFTQSK